MRKCFTQLNSFLMKFYFSSLPLSILPVCTVQCVLHKLYTGFLRDPRSQSAVVYTQSEAHVEAWAEKKVDDDHHHYAFDSQFWHLGGVDVSKSEGMESFCNCIAKHKQTSSFDTTAA